MKAVDFNLTNMNTTLRKAVLGQKVNYCQFLAMSFSERLSVIGREDKDAKFVTLDESLVPKELDDPSIPDDPASSEAIKPFYGASPLLDNKLILEAISSLSLSTEEGLQSFIVKHHDKFFITAPFKDHLPSIARYIVLAFSTNFGISVCAGKEEAAFDAFASRFPTTVEKLGADTKEKKKPPKYFIKGCPTLPMLDFLSDYRYLQGDADGEFVLADGGESIHAVYAKPGNVVLKNGAVFYSGVVPKTTRIEVLENVYENYKTSAILLHYVESSFATVFAFDKNFTKHPLLSGADKKAIVALLTSDDQRKMAMIKGIDELAADGEQTTKRIIEKVNSYLAASVNVNQIGVSANLTTENGLLLLGKRGQKTNSYDGRELYPSANGNVEFADERVSFYQYSTHEDVPTMKQGAVRNDFTGEITRETESELSVLCSDNVFSCVGLTICASIPETENAGKDSNENPSKAPSEGSSGDKNNEYTVSQRRCHFNIIYDAHIVESYHEVTVKSKNANEAFENERLRGLHVGCHKNIFTATLSLLARLIGFLSDRKDFFESVLIITLAALSWRTAESGSFSSWLSLILASVVLASTLIRLCLQAPRAWNYIRSCRNISLFRKTPIEKVEDRIKNSFKGFSYHPVTYAMVSFYVKQMAYMRFFDKGRRGD